MENNNDFWLTLANRLIEEVKPNTKNELHNLERDRLSKEFRDMPEKQFASVVSVAANEMSA